MENYDDEQQNKKWSEKQKWIMKLEKIPSIKSFWWNNMENNKTCNYSAFCHSIYRCTCGAPSRWRQRRRWRDLTREKMAKNRTPSYRINIINFWLFVARKQIIIRLNRARSRCRSNDSNTIRVNVAFICICERFPLLFCFTFFSSTSITFSSSSSSSSCSGCCSFSYFIWFENSILVQFIMTRFVFILFQ